VSLLLCEQVIIAETTHNCTPVNCFSRRVVCEFPSAPLSFVLLAHLTDGDGRALLAVSIERLDTQEEIYREEAAVLFDNPVREVRCVFRIRDCSFPAEGLYAAKVFADGEPLGQKRLLVVPKRKMPS
jgi:hypothetical protein